MRQASALTILVPSFGSRLVRWNKALPRLIKISTSIAITRYLNSTATHRVEQGAKQYIVSIKLGSRIFAPTVFTTLLTIVLIALLISLGSWQLRRADEKRVLFDSFAAGADATRCRSISVRPTCAATSMSTPAGHYDQTRQILIDNMVNGERAGYFVITPFALTGGGWVLVNRGWVPLGQSRAERPAIPVGGDTRAGPRPRR